MHFKQCHIKKTQESTLTGLLVIGNMVAEVRNFQNSKNEFTGEEEQRELRGWQSGGREGGSLRAEEPEVGEPDPCGQLSAPGSGSQEIS